VFLHEHDIRLLGSGQFREPECQEFCTMCFRCHQSRSFLRWCCNLVSFWLAQARPGECQNVRVGRTNILSELCLRSTRVPGSPAQLANLMRSTHVPGSPIPTRPACCKVTVPQHHGNHSVTRVVGTTIQAANVFYESSVIVESEFPMARVGVYIVCRAI